MRLLADENFPGPVIVLLRSAGHDVFSVKESMRSMPDDAILSRASDEQRILLTCDKDFGELAVRFKKPAHGIILFRLEGEQPEMDNTRMLHVIDSRDDWEGHLSVVTNTRIRMRPISRTEQGG
jgi:predicted nuclease of predicted toxin-antitoxin system